MIYKVPSISALQQSDPDIYLGCFHVLAIVNSAAVNMWVHVSFSSKVLSGYMPKSGVSESYGQDVEKREPSCTVFGECKLVQPLWRTVERYLGNLFIELPYDPAIPLWDKTLLEKDTCIHMFTAALFTIAKT